LRSQFVKIILKTGNDEKDISAIKEKEIKQTWLQGKDVDSKRQEGSFGAQSQRKEETYRYFRA
jgi:hypothetical protein